MSNRSLRKVLFLSLLLSVGSAAFSADEPDLNKEQRLHNNYQKYNLTPTNNESWSGATSGKIQTYKVQQSDTLWDLSLVLFDDPAFWPKVWSLNAESIENPHEIYPGLTLKFTAGTLNEPPTLAVAAPGEKIEDIPATSEAPTATVAATSTEVASAAGQTDEDIPAADPKNRDLMELANIPPEAPARPVTTFPKSIPKWSYGKRASSLELEVSKISRTFPASEEPLAYYLSEQSPVAAGSIIEAEMGQGTIAEFQYVTVKLEPGETHKQLLAVQEQEEIKDPVTKEKAKIVQVQGVIEIMEVVNSEENLHRGMVKKLINPVKVGATLTAMSLPQFRAQATSMGSGQARVIGGQHSAERRLIELNSLVYLAGSGLNEGDSYPIFKKQNVREEKSRSFENPVRIGTVKVIKIASGFATGVVVDEQEEIHVGDVTDPHMR